MIMALFRTRLDNGCVGHVIELLVGACWWLLRLFLSFIVLTEQSEGSDCIVEHAFYAHILLLPKGSPSTLLSPRLCDLPNMTDFAYPLFPIVSFIGFVLALVPLLWHLQAWNSGTCYFMLWTALSCLNKFVNSVVWAGNVANTSPAICEICELQGSHRIPRELTLIFQLLALLSVHLSVFPLPHYASTDVYTRLRE